MGASEQIAERILNLKGDEFFADEATVRGKREWALLDTVFEGIAVNAPAEVDTAKRQTLPVSAAMRVVGARAADVPFDRNAFPRRDGPLQREGVCRHGLSRSQGR